MLSPSFHRFGREALLSILFLASVLLAVACLRDARSLDAASKGKKRISSGLASRTWPLCSLIGPRNKDGGVYGTDLGFTVSDPRNAAAGDGDGRLAILFGDTWAKAVDACRYPVFDSDDLQASLPARRPAAFGVGAPKHGEATACGSLQYPLKDPKDPTSWPRIRLFRSSKAKSSDRPLDTGGLRTPVTAFSDGQKIFAMYFRFDPVPCHTSEQCPDGMVCSTDPSYRGKPLGECSQTPGLSADPPRVYCRDGGDCGPMISCEPAKRGVCLAAEPFAFTANGRPLKPQWYRDDPRRALAHTMYMAAAIWPDRPTDYAVIHKFQTHRFMNATARTVRYFDPEHPEKNDYRPGFHTLLLFGRSHFVATNGAQILPFLLYQPLEELRGDKDASRWNPRFFAGYDAEGRPRWSRRECDAVPIYGTEAELVNAEPPRIRWAEPEFDYVDQMTVSWIEPLGRWVMLYGGDVPAFLVLDPGSNEALQPVHLQPTAGAIHLRAATHPWGRATRDRPEREGWSSPEPVLTRQVAAPYLACGDGGQKEMPGCLEDADPNDGLDLIAALGRLTTKTTPGKFMNTTGSCLGGELAMAAQDAFSGNLIGRLYGVNIIDEWTEEVTDELGDLDSGERAVEIYWNASTWNPYQVVLFKTQLRGRR